ncbi:MAG: Stage sporulation family protein [Frankiales bacterium]|nr:Stage sporulation family protein [Frankiales bacterium]
MEMFRRGEDRRFSLDLAEHLVGISTPPDLGDGWACEVAVALADDAAIGGDFTVFSIEPTSGCLRAMIVDASGKGAEAATRAVMLAGAVSGLLAELPLVSVLPAVNRHVARLGSDENFATAVLLELDLTTGVFELSVAGHPQPMMFDASSGRWRTFEVTGPALGFLPDATWHLHSDQLDVGDALLVVTDGMIEVPGTDLDVGVDRLVGQAEHLVLSGWDGGAEKLLGQRRRAGSDDAQVLLLSRRASR